MDNRPFTPHGETPHGHGQGERNSPLGARRGVSIPRLPSMVQTGTTHLKVKTKSLILSRGVGRMGLDPGLEVAALVHVFFGKTRKVSLVFLPGTSLQEAAKIAAKLLFFQKTPLNWQGQTDKERRHKAFPAPPKTRTSRSGS